jgi:hypothetical protein
MCSVGHGILDSAINSSITAPRAILVFPFLHHEHIPHGGPNTDTGLQLFQAGPAHTVSTQTLLRTGQWLREPHHEQHMGRSRRRAAWHERKRRPSRRPSSGGARQLQRWRIKRPRGQALGGRRWQRWPRRLSRRGQPRRRVNAAALAVQGRGSNYDLVGSGSCSDDTRLDSGGCSADGAGELGGANLDRRRKRRGRTRWQRERPGVLRATPPLGSDLCLTDCLGIGDSSLATHDRHDGAVLGTRNAHGGELLGAAGGVRATGGGRRRAQQQQPQLQIPGSGGGIRARTMGAHNNKGHLGGSGGLVGRLWGASHGDLLGSSRGGPGAWRRTRQGQRPRPRRARLRCSGWPWLGRRQP